MKQARQVRPYRTHLFAVRKWPRRWCAPVVDCKASCAVAAGEGGGLRAGPLPGHVCHPAGEAGRDPADTARHRWGWGDGRGAGGGIRGPGPRERARAARGPAAEMGWAEGRATPPGKYRKAWRSRQNTGEDGATPGGYGGKPPGVAFIGVPTGARNAGRCSDGGPEHRMHVTPKTPLARQDRFPRGRCFSNRGRVPSTPGESRPPGAGWRRIRD